MFLTSNPSTQAAAGESHKRRLEHGHCPLLGTIMPSLAAQAVKLSSLAGALLLSTGLITHLHLLHSKSLPSTVATYSRPAPSTLLSHGAGAGASKRPAQIEFSVAGERMPVRETCMLWQRSCPANTWCPCTLLLMPWL